MTADECSVQLDGIHHPPSTLTQHPLLGSEQDIIASRWMASLSSLKELRGARRWMMVGNYVWNSLHSTLIKLTAACHALPCP